MSNKRKTNDKDYQWLTSKQLRAKYPTNKIRRHFHDTLTSAELPSVDLPETASMPYHKRLYQQVIHSNLSDGELYGNIGAQLEQRGGLDYYRGILTNKPDGTNPNREDVVRVGLSLLGMDDYGPLEAYLNGEGDNPLFNNPLMQQNHDVVDLTGDEVIDLTGGSVFNFDVPSLLTEKAQLAHNVLTRGNTAESLLATESLNKRIEQVKDIYRPFNKKRATKKPTIRRKR